MKQNQVLAQSQDKQAQAVAILSDYTKFFSSNQSYFLGKNQVYTHLDANALSEGKDSSTQVATTVNEKLDYLIKELSSYVHLVMTKERTNGLGISKAELFVDGKSWGEFTSNELLCLKSMVENPNLKQMLGNIPTRSIQDTWKRSSNEEYKNRLIFEKPTYPVTHRTTVKVSYTIEDVNVKNLKDTSNYKSPIGERTTPIEIGVTNTTEYSGQWGYVEKAEALSRLGKIKEGVVDALIRANDIEAVETSMTSQKLFGYLFYGQNN